MNSVGVMMGKRQTGSAKRTKIIPVRMNESEYSEIKILAEKSNRKVSELLRDEVFNKTIINSNVELKKIAAINRIGNNLNQIAKWCNQYAHEADALEILKQLNVLERAIKELLKC